jgi:hypothetical protein
VISWNQQGPAGTNGSNGNTVLNGAGAPSNSIGADGDFYLNTSNYVLFGPKAAGTWPTTGVSLVGPAGSGGSNPLLTVYSSVTFQPTTFGCPADQVTFVVDRSEGTALPSITFPCAPISTSVYSPMYSMAAVTSSTTLDESLLPQGTTPPANTSPAPAYQSGTNSGLVSCTYSTASFNTYPYTGTNAVLGCQVRLVGNSSTPVTATDLLNLISAGMQSNPLTFYSSAAS